MASLDGKVALVTGASRGLGRAIALRLAKDGAAVGVNYFKSEAQAEEVVAAIAAFGGCAAPIQADVTRVDQIESLFDKVVGKFGRLDILVNNAGVSISTPFASLTEDQYDHIFANTKGVYFMLKRAASAIADNGRIINLSSGMTRNWAPHVAAYAGSKAAVEQFTRSLSKELGPRGVTVNAVLPGWIATDMTASFPDAVREQARLQISLQRLGEPDDVADVVSFLAGPDSRWITGQLLVANGGSTP